MTIRYICDVCNGVYKAFFEAVACELTHLAPACTHSRKSITLPRKGIYECKRVVCSDCGVTL